MNALVYVDIDQGIHKGKMKVALKEKQKKLHGFSFSINIANFKAFLSVFKLTKNLFFLKSDGLPVLYSLIHYVLCFLIHISLRDNFNSPDIH